MRRKQLLFSKREKEEKSTAMGQEDEKLEGNLGLPNNNSDLPENNNDKNVQNPNAQQNNENKTQIEKVSTEVFNNENIIKKPKKDLKKELEELKKELQIQRKESISKVTELNEKDIKTTKELKELTNKYNNLIDILKTYEQSLVVRTRNISKKKETEKDIKKHIQVLEAQIKSYDDRSNIVEEDYNKFKKYVNVEKHKENDLNTELTDLNSEISEKNQEIKYLKITSNTHLYCANENKKLLDKFSALNTTYQYELKRAKQLALIELGKDEDDQEIKEEYDQKDDKAKAEEDEKNLLPKIKVLRYKGEKLQKLEMKIIKRNKIGVIKSNEFANCLKYYKKLNSELNDEDAYVKNRKKYNSLIRKNRIEEINSEGNYLFDKENEKIIEKILPDEKVNIYRNKYEDVLNQKKEIEEIMKTDCNTIQKEKESIFNKCEYNNMELKNKKIDNLQLVMKSQKLRDKINNMKQIIKQYREKINKEDKKLNEEKRMNNYYKKLKEIQKSSLE